MLVISTNSSRSSVSLVLKHIIGETSVSHPFRWWVWNAWLNKLNKNKLFNSSSTISLFNWETRLDNGSFWIKVMTLVQNITENRFRHARGPVYFTSSPLYKWMLMQQYKIFHLWYGWPTFFTNVQNEGWPCLINAKSNNLFRGWWHRHWRWCNKYLVNSFWKVHYL